MWKVLGLFLVPILSPSNAGAYFIGNLDGRPIEFTRPSHFIIAGFADKVGPEFIKSAASRAYRLRMAFPDDQILVLRGNEEDWYEARDGILARGLSIIESNTREDLNGERLLSFLARFTAIRSLAIFSHSGPFNGSRLSEDGTRLHTGLSKLTRLRGKFTPDAYVSLFGCNSIYELAPMLSRAWEVPVSGAATGTDFEELFSDNQWYMHNEGQYPSRLTRASRNRISLDGNLPCSKAGCTRMRPQNSPYNGDWGTFDAGLPFYKFMCNFSPWDAAAEERCYRGMARSMAGFVSTMNLGPTSVLADYREVMFDYFCPSKESRTGQAKCREKILKAEAEGNTVLNVFSGNALECSLRACNSRFEEHTSFFGNVTFRMYAPANSAPRSLMEDWSRILQGLSLIGLGP